MSENTRELASLFVQKPTDDELEKSYNDVNELTRLQERSARQGNAAMLGVSAATALQECVRYMNPDKAMRAAFVGVLTQYTHRYTQAEIFRELILPLIKEWANQVERGQFDARNEWVVRLCKRIVETERL